MFRRKFVALDFPNPEAFDITDENKFRCVIQWLEDQKIRHLKIEDREPLKQAKGDDWEAALKQYLAQLNCPYDVRDRRALLDWLLGYAVRLEFGDDVEKYKNVTPEKLQQQSSQKPLNSTNPLDSLDFESAEFKAGVTSLAMLLQIPPHHDHLDLLKAICVLVNEKFSQEALDSAQKHKNVKDEHIPLDKTELGFEAGDYIMTEAAKILRLLHIRDLRDLQTKINAAIVEFGDLVTLDEQYLWRAYSRWLRDPHSVKFGDLFAKDEQYLWRAYSHWSWDPQSQAGNLTVVHAYIGPDTYD